MKKYNKCKAIAFVLSFVVALSLFAIAPKQKIYAAGISISASSTNVNVGDTVTITVSVPSGYFGRVGVTASGAALGDTSQKTLVLGDIGINQLSDTITYTAVEEGSCTITASEIDISDINEADPGFAPVSVTINVANKTSTPENPSAGGTDSNPTSTQSSDNTLQSLAISPGTLSPTFSKNKTTYTAIVDNSVTKITVSAKTNDANANVSSVTGNDNLVVGENTISIKVKAENGVSKTYKIVVTRKDENGQVPTIEVPEPATYTLGEKTLFVSEMIADSMIPSDFSKDTITLNGTEYPCLVHANGQLTLLSLMEENSTDGQLYLLNREENSVSPFIRLVSENGYLILLSADADKILPEYEEEALSIEGKGLVSAYKAEKDPEDFYLLYGMNQQEKTGWYWYDVTDGTYLRYEEIEDVVIVEPDTTALDVLQNQYDALQKEYTQWKETAKWAVLIAGATFLVMLIAIVMLIIFRRKSRKPKKTDEAVTEEITCLDAVITPEQEPTPEEEIEPEEETEIEEETESEPAAEIEPAAESKNEEEPAEIPDIEAALMAEMAKMEAEIVDSEEEKPSVHRENIHEIEAATLEEFLDERSESIKEESIEEESIPVPQDVETVEPTAEPEAAQTNNAEATITNEVTEEDDSDDGLEFIDL